MRSLSLVAPVLVLALALPAAARAQAWDATKGVVGKATTGQLEQEINRRLLAESRRNQCSFVTDTDRLAPGCGPKIRRLADALVDAKKKLNGAGVRNFKFVVSGHTDSRGSKLHNKKLSARRAAVIERELVRKGIPRDEIESVGMGSERRLVKPDDTPAKQAKNRRYEIRVRL
jgi:outer membrane protein OmpA-like peptidoglycan-associated protein